MAAPTSTEIEAKSTLFLQHTTLQCRGRLLSLSKPLVMGILNVTPDSFYDGGRYDTIEAALIRADKMLDEGADILDVGGVSTRPGAPEISVQEELDRVIPPIESILQKHPDAIISVDTYRSEVVRAVVAAGAAIINDISGGTMDPLMFGTVASLHVPYILMHMQGSPATMQQNPQYTDVTREVISWMSERVMQLRVLGVKDIIVDPGFGFGKTASHNYTLMRELEFFSILQLPLLVGISRKSMIYKSFNIKAEDSLTGSTALHYHALTRGANILRVHDVREAKQTVAVYLMVHSEQNRFHPI
jgi:dihydropteroate synthase